MSNNALDILKDRGFFKQCTDEEALRKAFDEGAVSAYVGFDPTGDSLHVGHLFPLMALIHLERMGHRPIVVLGGGTALIGDPSGKSEMRQMLTTEQIKKNIEKFQGVMGRLLHFEEGKSRVVDNAEWLTGLNYIEFLRDVGRHFSVNRMLSAEAYKMRLEKGLSFIEFNYQILQAYDFMELNKRYGCTVQMGGDDQWGNILAGVDLTRRLNSDLVFGLTFPLQLTATGEKMGKTAGGAVWLEADKLKPYDYYQYWVNTHDDDVERILGLFTFLPMDEIRAVASLEGADLNVAKSILAYEATAVVHGKQAATSAHAAAQGAFGGRAIPTGILPSSDVSRKASADAEQIPTTEVELSSLEAGILLADLMLNTGLSASKSAARRLIEQGAVRLNDERVSDTAYQVSLRDFNDSILLVRAGKKKFHRVVLA
jgi:tyrosyl-tRNA synthetase